MSVVKRILSYLKLYRGYFAWTMLFALIGTGLSLVIPILIGYSVDCMIGPGDVDFPDQCHSYRA